MRILANYGHKTNGDSYSVTFETMGDVPQDQAPLVVDELFALAKEAVQRQIPACAKASAGREDNGHTGTEVIPPEPNGNGNSSGKSIRNPNAPATEKQLAYIEKLAKRSGQKIDLNRITTMGEASQIIDDLSH